MLDGITAGDLPIKIGTGPNYYRFSKQAEGKGNRLNRRNAFEMKHIITNKCL